MGLAKVRIKDSRRHSWTTNPCDFVGFVDLHFNEGINVASVKNCISWIRATNSNIYWDQNGSQFHWFSEQLHHLPRRHARADQAQWIRKL